MVRTEIDLHAPPDEVFDHLLDVSRYPGWLAGAQKIRAVDDAWPEPGSEFHHTVGVGPVRIKDSTTVFEVDRPRLLVLKAKAGPLGSALVRFELEDRDAGTHLVFSEEPYDGLMRRLWSTVGRWLLGLGIWGRNAASLQSLSDLIDRDRRPDQ
jgi:uncharacterized protein YndB with AHSA1/START domain